MLPVSLAITILFGWGDTFPLALLSSIAFAIGFQLLWRPGESPVLIFIFLYHWLQGSLYIFYARISGLPINSISSYTSSLDTTIALTLLGVIFFAIGLRVGAGPINRSSVQITRSQIKLLPQHFWLRVYIASFITSFLALGLTVFSPGLTQPLVAISGLHWAAYFALTVSSFGNPDASRRLWLAVFALELLISLGGFFSSFKLAFIFSFFGILASGTRLNRTQSLRLSLLVVGALSLGVVWTAVKPSYREYVSAGEITQKVLVSKSEAISKLIDLTSELTTDQLLTAVQRLVARISEIDIFGAAVDHVPRFVPYANGAVWYDSIMRFLVPRMLSPGKAIVDDSLLTNAYTGLGVATMEQGTQISMGFYADSYVDFGPVGMMLTLCAFGIFAGLVYRFLANGLSSRGIVGMSLATVSLYRLESVGFSSAKVLPGLVISLIAYSLLYYVALYKLERTDSYRGRRNTHREVRGDPQFLDPQE